MPSAHSRSFSAGLEAHLAMKQELGRHAARAAGRGADSILRVQGRQAAGPRPPRPPVDRRQPRHLPPLPSSHQAAPKIAPRERKAQFARPAGAGSAYPHLCKRRLAPVNQARPPRRSALKQERAHPAVLTPKAPDPTLTGTRPTQVQQQQRVHTARKSGSSTAVLLCTDTLYMLACCA